MALAGYAERMPCFNIAKTSTIEEPKALEPHRGYRYCRVSERTKAGAR